MELARLIDEFREARRLAVLNPHAAQQAREAVLACDKLAVQTYLDGQLQDSDFEKRCQAVEDFTLLYRTDAVESIVRYLGDESSEVRWVVCGCLHDFGDGRAQAGLLDRLKQDLDPQVRGLAASALGRIGDPEVLPDLYTVTQSDHEVDPMGYAPSSQANEAISDLLRRWVIQQIHGRSATQFRESFATGELTVRVVAEDIPFDDQGRITHTERYAQLPISALGPGWSSKIDLQPHLTAPFEVEIAFVNPHYLIQRIFIFRYDAESTITNWSVHSILNMAAVPSDAVYRALPHSNL